MRSSSCGGLELLLSDNRAVFYYWSGYDKREGKRQERSERAKVITGQNPKSKLVCFVNKMIRNSLVKGEKISSSLLDFRINIYTFERIRFCRRRAEKFFHPH